eukprot:Clim_evm15s209 gene=Clim_evmTU15s209
MVSQKRDALRIIRKPKFGAPAPRTRTFRQLDRLNSGKATSTTKSVSTTVPVSTGTNLEELLEAKSKHPAIQELLAEAPQVERSFRITDRLGEGTYSTVYLATRRSTGHLVAVKRLYQTVIPKRIVNEVKALKQVKGKKNVCRLLETLKCHHSFFLIIDYFEHEDLQTYLGKVTVREAKAYMTCLLTALQGVHAEGIIHRDVKPANFLFHRRSCQGMLVDFGLAQTMKDAEAKAQKKANRIAPTQQRAFRERQGSNRHDITSITTLGENFFYANDRRPKDHVERQGTRGFRAPEILLRSSQQGAGVDMWAAGITFLSLLTGIYPFFICADDANAVAENIEVFGARPMRDFAKILGKELVTTGYADEPRDLHHVVSGTNPDLNWGTTDMECSIDLLKNLLTVNMHRRPDAEECLQHHFITVSPSSPGGVEEDLSAS